MNQWATQGRAYYMNAAIIQTLSPNNCLKIAQGQHEMLQRLPGAGSIVHAELFPPSATESLSTEVTAFAQRTTGRQVVAKIIWDDQEFPIVNVREEMQRFLAIIEQRQYVAPLVKSKPAYSNYSLSSLVWIRTSSRSLQLTSSTAETEVLADDAVRLAYGANYPRLQQIKAKYE